MIVNMSAKRLSPLDIAVPKSKISPGITKEHLRAVMTLVDKTLKIMIASLAYTIEDKYSPRSIY